MRFDLQEVGPQNAYKLLAATVMPRPIAWVVTQDGAGRVNAAPFSFFNVMGASPPTVVLGVMPDPVKGLKDTARIILDTGEFVINLVPERLVHQMNQTAIDAPAGVEELALAGLGVTASDRVAPPRITASPVAFECKLTTHLETGPNQMLLVAEVLVVHLDDDCVLDAERAYIDTPKLDLVARSYGSDYVRSQDVFQLARPVWREWAKAHPEAAAAALDPAAVPPNKA